MSYDKDWEVHLALNDPNDPIHDYTEQSERGNMMSSNGWKTVYEDDHVKVNVGPRGEVGVWHGATGNWRLQNVRDHNVTRYGTGPTMDAARKDAKRAKRAKVVKS